METESSAVKLKLKLVDMGSCLMVYQKACSNSQIGA